MKSNNYISWSNKEIKFLVDNYVCKGLEYCFIKLNRSKSAIKYKIEVLRKTINLGRIHKTYTIEDCKSIAKSKGFSCVSTTYINSKTSMKWKCKHNHTWYARFGDVKNKKSWCAYCSRKAPQIN